MGTVASLRFDNYRAGSGEPLVLLHGLTASWRAWQPVCEQLATSYDVYAPTLPGHRDGPPLVGPATIATVVDGVERSLDSASIHTAHLAGNSLGGLVAMELLRRGRARSVVNFNGPIAWSRPGDIRRLIRMFAINERIAHRGAIQSLASRSASVRRMMLRQAMNHGDRISPAQIRDAFADIRACSLPRALLRDLRENGPFPDLDAGAVPVRIVWSTEDRVVPYGRYGRPTVNRVRGAQISELAGMGHVPMWDNPELVIATIRETVETAVACGVDSWAADNSV